MTKEIKKEECIYGKNWNLVHGGYFSDPEVAAPLVRKVQEFAEMTRPDIIIDLGGGVGFLLSQLRAVGLERKVSLLNLDDSPVQLQVAEQDDISCAYCSVNKFSRQDLGLASQHVLFMMRSVLHYFGQSGLCPLLRHLRTQIRQGEYFIHQSASFYYQQDADCLNEIYQMMGTQKWYPSVDYLCQCLRSQGWDILEVFPTMSLPLTAAELRTRYCLEQTDILRIQERLDKRYQVSDEVLKKNKRSFLCLSSLLDLCM